MLNIERYRKELENYGASLDCDIHKIRENNEGIRNHLCISKPCSECRKENMQWLLEEYKEPILDDAEKEYLSAVIKPFRKKISCIRKTKDPRKGKNYIKIEFCDGDLMHFPNLSNDAMYKGMKLDRKYTLEELGL